MKKWETDTDTEYAKFCSMYRNCPGKYTTEISEKIVEKMKRCL